MDRRGLITGLISLIAAPAIVRAGSLMPVKSMRMPGTDCWVNWYGSDLNEGTAGNPWATIQHAVNVISKEMNLNGAAVTVNVGEGTYSGFRTPPMIGGFIEIKGDAGRTFITRGTLWQD